MSMSQLGLLTSQEAADRAKVDRRTIRRWVASGRLVPAYTLPGVTGAHLFNAEDVDNAAGASTEQAS